MAPGEGTLDENLGNLDEDVVQADYPLDALDPTQRAFAHRVLKWGDQVVQTYKDIQRDGKPRAVPKIRSWLCGSAGSGKSTTLKTIVQHLRPKFQNAGVAASLFAFIYNIITTLEKILTTVIISIFKSKVPHKRNVSFWNMISNNNF